MIIKDIELELDGLPLQRTPIILNQANINSVVFNYKIENNSQEINYLEYTRAELIFRKKDGSNVVDNGSISADGISYTLNQHIFDIAGIVTGQINLYRDDTVSSTLHYEFRIIEDLFNIVKTSKPYVITLDEMVAKYQALLDNFPDVGGGGLSNEELEKFTEMQETLDDIKVTIELQLCLNGYTWREYFDSAGQQLQNILDGGNL